MALRTSVGYRTVFAPRLQVLSLAHGGFSSETEDGAKAIFDQLLVALDSGEAQALLLPSLPVGSPLHELARRVSAFRRQQFLPRRVHRRLVLAETYDAFLRERSRSTRDAVKRYTNRLLREHGDRLSLEVYRDSGQFERMAADLEAVAARTYQRGLGVSFVNSGLQRDLTRLGLERGWFRAYVLYLDGAPIAFWPGWAYRRTFFIGTPGFDPAYGEYRVGQYVQMRLIEDLCADPDIDALDYGFGDAEYKRRFGSEDWEEEDVLIYALRAPALAVNGVRSAILGSATLARRAIGGERAARIKRGWRRRLAAER